MQNKNNIRLQLLYKKLIIPICYVYIFFVPILFQKLSHSGKSNPTQQREAGSAAPADDRYLNNEKQKATPDLKKLKQSNAKSIRQYVAVMETNV